MTSCLSLGKPIDPFIFPEVIPALFGVKCCGLGDISPKNTQVGTSQK